MNEIRKAIQDKIGELQWKSEVKTILLIEWLEGLLRMLPEEKEEVKEVKEVKVEVPQTPKKKITFNKKK